MRVGYLQFCPVFGEKDLNLKKVRELIEGAEVDLLVLPELFNTGYLFASKDELVSLSEHIPEGLTTQTLLEISRGRGVYLVAGVSESEKGQFYNSAVLTYPDGSYRVYRKAHLFREEKLYFRPGNIPFEVYRAGEANVGVMVCWDWIYPESSRILSLKGAQVICHPANLVLPYCQNAMITRAIENRVFIITANRTGEERRGGRELRFTGGSQVVGPAGDVLLKAEGTEEVVGVVEIDPELASSKAMTGSNDLFRDRRVDLYGEICGS